MKRIAFPFGVATTSFMMMGFDKAKAETIEVATKPKKITDILWERGNVGNSPFADSGTPDGMGFGDNFGEAMDLWIKVGGSINSVLEWINNLQYNITHLSVDLLAWIYKTLSMLILHTPVLLFNNDWFKDNIFTFTAISVAMFTIGFLFQTIKKTVSAKEFGKLIDKNIQYQETSDIIKRYSLAVVGIGFAPFLFKKGFGILNSVAKFITSLGYHEVKANEFADMTKAGWGDTVALLGFDIVLIGTLIPLFLQNGRRWFDLICLGAMTPFALSAWVLKDTRHYTTMWWDSIKKIGMVQIVYSTFLAIMGIFMLGTRGLNTGFGLIFKLAVMAGALWRMQNPPKFMNRMMDTEKVSYKDMYSEVKDVATLGNISKYKPVNFAKNLVLKGINTGKVNEAKKEMGQRYVGSNPNEVKENLENFRAEQKRKAKTKRYNK